MVLIVATPVVAQRDTLCRERVPNGPEVRIAGPEEPGQPMVIAGHVVEGSDRTPVGGAVLLAFHTDAAGYYSIDGMDEQNARLCGVLRTAEDGSFRIETIRPAHYATGGPPAHVHFELTLPDRRTRDFSLTFEGDPELGGRRAGDLWDTIRPVIERDGLQYVERDLWVR